MDRETVSETIRELLAHMGFAGDIESIDVHQGATSRFSIHLRGSGHTVPHEYPDEFEPRSDRRSSASILIGERGNTLAAIECLLKAILRKRNPGEDFKFTLDINDYRLHGLEDLKQDVKTAAKDVRTFHREVPLRPMSSFERRIVHLLLAEYPDITTESVGSEPERRVIIKPLP